MTMDPQFALWLHGFIIGLLASYMLRNLVTIPARWREVCEAWRRGRESLREGG